MSAQQKLIMLQKTLRFILLVLIANWAMRYADRQSMASDYYQPATQASSESPSDRDEELTETVVNQAQVGESYFPDQETRSRFEHTLRRLLARENRSLQWQHQRLLNLAPAQANSVDKIWFSALAEEYAVECGDHCLNDNIYSLLLKKVDSVPVDALLVAAAVSSRFGVDASSQKHRNLFALWQSKPPQRYRADTIYPWRSFVRWSDSVRAFVHFINTDAAFAGFRKARALQQPEQRQLQEIREALLRITPKQRTYWEHLEKTLSQPPAAASYAPAGQVSG